MDARDDSVGLDHKIVATIGRQEGVVVLETACALEAAGKRRKVAGYEVELAEPP